MLDPVKRLEQIRISARERKQQITNTENTQLKLFEELLPTPSGNPQYPTLFTRCPVFAPARFRKTLDTDWENGHEIETSWGRIVRYGPGLNTFDEDSLIAIYHLCQQRRLKGLRRNMPVPVLRVVSDDYGDRKEGENEEVEVLAGAVTAYAINQFLGRSTTGNELNATRCSIKRLVLTKLFIFNRGCEKEGTVSFFDYIGDSDCRGELYIQFHPVAIKLLNEYTYINMDIRRELSDVGKSLHKFLSSQPKHYAISLDKLKMATGCQQPIKKFKITLRTELNKLVKLGWMKRYVISGTGRKIPFKLTVQR